MHLLKISLFFFFRKIVLNGSNTILSYIFIVQGRLTNPMKGILEKVFTVVEVAMAAKQLKLLAGRSIETRWHANIILSSVPCII